MEFDLDQKCRYSFFDGLDAFKSKCEALFQPPFSFKIKISNFSNNDTVQLQTDLVSMIGELPQSISDLVKTYAIIQHYIRCFSDEYFLHFKVTFQSMEKDMVSRTFEQIFMVRVGELKQMITEKRESEEKRGSEEK
jgi:ribosomal protein L23